MLLAFTFSVNSRSFVEANGWTTFWGEPDFEVKQNSSFYPLNLPLLGTMGTIAEKALKVCENITELSSLSCVSEYKTGSTLFCVLVLSNPTYIDL